MRVYKTRNTMYLRRDKYSALADWITRNYGSEPGYDWEMPTIELFKDTKPKDGTLHTLAYYNEGGNNWPDRLLLCREVIKQ